jgi:uncharacterized protein YhjY with autotransporter beta-barrel domain
MITGLARWLAAQLCLVSGLFGQRTARNISIDEVARFVSPASRRAASPAGRRRFGFPLFGAVALGLLGLGVPTEAFAVCFVSPSSISYTATGQTSVAINIASCAHTHGLYKTLNENVSDDPVGLSTETTAYNTFDTGKATYLAAWNEAGSYTFQFLSKDSGVTATSDTITLYTVSSGSVVSLPVIITVTLPSAPVVSAFTSSAVAYNAGSASATSIDVSGHATNSPTSYYVGTSNGPGITSYGGSVSVSSAGMVSYTPPVGYRGSDTFAFTASNSAGASNIAYVTVPVSDPTISVTPTMLPGGAGGIAYSQSLTAAGGKAPYTLSTTLASGALPSGLTLAGNGTISGTTTATGTFTFTVTGTDSSTGTGPATFTSATLSLTIATTVPTVSAISPMNGPTGGGTSVTITGTGFSFANNTGAVKFGTTVATYTINSDTQITATAPAGTAGPVDITVTTPGGTSATNAGDQFTYVAAPVGSSFTASSIAYNTGSASATTIAVSGHVTNSPTSYGVGSSTTANGGTVSINSAGNASYTPPAGFRGNDSFTFTATNAGGTSSPATVTVPVSDPTITVTPTTLTAGTGGVAYSQSLTASGGKAPYSFSTTLASGALPSGLTLSSSGTISGTTTATGTFTFTVTGTDSSTGTGNASFTSATISLIINAPTITVSGTLPSPTLNTAYSQSVSASGGASPYTYSILTGALPTGITLNSSTGLVSGTTTVAGSYAFTIKATDNNGFTGQQAYNWTVAAPTLAMTPASSAGLTGTGGTAYSQAFAASGGVGPYTYVLTVTSGSLPTGLAFSGNTLSGTPTSTGSVSFTVKATDTGSSGTGSPFSVTNSFTLAVSAPAPTVSAVNPVNGSTVGGTSVTITGSGFTYAAGTGAVKFGSTVASYTVNSDSSITATAPAGTAGTVNVTVTTPGGTSATNAGDQFTYVAAPVGSSFTASAVAYNTGSASATTIAASGHATNSPTSYAVGSSTTANGGTVSINSAGNASYTPPAGLRGNDSFTFTASNAGGTSSPATVTVPVSDPTITVTPTALTAGTAGVAYSQSLTAAGGKAPYSFSTTLASGALPSGLTLSSAGTISGTTTATGNFTFTVAGTDSSTGTGNTSFTSATISLTINAPTISLTGTLPSPTLNTAYSQSVSAGGGTTPYTYSIATGALPTGITLNSATGAVSGTTTVAGSYAFTIKATDRNSFFAQQAYSWTVGAPTLAMTPASSAGLTGTGGTAYSQAFTASGGVGPYTYVLTVTSGSLPTGLAFSGNTLSGTPTTAGSVSFTVKATDTGSSGTGAPFSVTNSFTLAVAAPTITLTGTLPTATLNTAYSQSLSAGGGTAPYTYSVVTGALPTGITLNGSTGAVSGTTTVAGSYNFTIKAADTNGFFVQQAYSWTIAAPILAMTPASSAGLTGTAEAAYSQAFTTSGGVGPYSYVLTVTSGSLPTGLAFSGNTLSGTPTTAGSVSFTVKATDTGSSGTGAPFSVTNSFTLAIAAPTLTFTPASLPAATVSAAYSQSLTASGGTAPYVFALAGGSGPLPAGLTLSSAGVLSGTPTAGGAFPIAIKATDHNNFSVANNYTLIVASAAVSLSPSTLPTPQVGFAYSQTFTASGGTAPYQYSSSGTLPPGLSLNRTTGVLSGTPTQAGNFSGTIQATDSSTGTGPYHASVAFNFGVNQAVPASKALQVSTAANAAVQLNLAASLAPTNPGVTLTAAAVASAPAHGAATVSGTTITYTPAANYFGSDSFTYTATGPGGTSTPATVSVTVTPLAVPVVQPVTLAVLTNAPVSFDATANATNGPFTAVPVAIAAAPASGTATVSGTKITYTPAAGQTVKTTVTFTYTVSNAFGPSAPATATITVNPIPVTAPPQTVVAQAPSPTQPATVNVDITANAAGGPFVAATLISVEPPNAGTVTLVPINTQSSLGVPHIFAAAFGIKPAVADTVTVSGHAFNLVFVPNPAFTGTATITYSLANAFAESVPGTIIFVVTPRANPALDADVNGLITAQIEAARRFASAQIGNFNQRLEQLHDDLAGHFSNAIHVGFGDRMTSQTQANPDDDPLTRGTTDIHRPKGDTATNTADAGQAHATGGDGSGNGNGGGTSLLPDGLAFWTGGSVDFGARSTTERRSGFDFTTDGVSAGADYRVTPHLTLGIGGGWGHDSSDIGDDGSKSIADSYSAVVYGTYHPSTDTFLDGVLGYGWLSYDSNRLITGTADFARGHRDGDQSFGSLTAGYQYRDDRVRLTPYARFDYSDSTLNRFSETAPGTAALTYFDQSATTLTGTLGFKGELSVPLEWGLFEPFLRAEFLHDFQSETRAGLAYADLATAGPAYYAPGVPLDRNHMQLGLGGDLRVYNYVFGLSVENEFGMHEEQESTVRFTVTTHF